MIVTIENLSTPDSVNRAQPIFANPSWNFQVFEIGRQLPGDISLVWFHDWWLKMCKDNNTTCVVLFPRGSANCCCQHWSFSPPDPILTICLGKIWSYLGFDSWEVMKIEFDRDWLPRSLIGCSVIVQEEYFSQEIRQKVISCCMYYCMYLYY